MGKIILDRVGDLRKGLFYRFDVQFNDVPYETPTREWFVAPRIPTNDELEQKGNETWMWITPGYDLDAVVATKDCPSDVNHVTFSLYTGFEGEAFGGDRVSPFLPTDSGYCFVLSEGLNRQISVLKIRGARIDAIDLHDHVTSKKLKGFGALQFVGRARLRLPKLVDVPNLCPICGKGNVFCEHCGDWPGVCPHCKSHMIILESRHCGKEDRRIPFEANLSSIIEGRTWDGSDLLQARGRNFASKRFVDWLLRIHAAPFYAEPVWFCVDGMTDDQKMNLDKLQKALDS